LRQEFESSVHFFLEDIVQDTSSLAHRACCAMHLMLLLHHVACGALLPYSSIGTRRVHLIAVALIASLALHARHSPHRTVCDESRAARNIDSLNAAFAAHRDKLSQEVTNRRLASA
jgi:hypothetical protein